LSIYGNPDNHSLGDWSSTPWCASCGQGGIVYGIIYPAGKKYKETTCLGTLETS